MRVHRFIKDVDLDRKVVRIEDKSFSDQIRRELRMQVGDRLVLSDGQGKEALGKIVNFAKGIVDVKILTSEEIGFRMERKVHLYCSILQRKNFELVVQKATEVGVVRVVPLICKRTVKLNIRRERMKKIIKEAGEQSGRSVIPQLSHLLNFSEAVKLSKNHHINLFFQQGEKKLSCKDLSGLEEIGVWIGPEGGWDKNEEKMVNRISSFRLVGLGSLTLRAETAAIVSSFLALYL